MPLAILAAAGGPLTVVVAIAVHLPIPPPLHPAPAQENSLRVYVPTTVEPLSLIGHTDRIEDHTDRTGRIGGYPKYDKPHARATDNVVVRVVVAAAATSTLTATTTTTTTSTTTSTESSSSSTSTTTTTTITTPAPSASSTSRSCDLRYCDAGTSYCEYWGGYSSFDVSLGRPVPGETRTSVGTCNDTASTSTASTTSSTAGSSSSTSGSDPLDTSTCTSTIQTAA